MVKDGEGFFEDHMNQMLTAGCQSVGYEVDQGTIDRSGHGFQQFLHQMIRMASTREHSCAHPAHVTGGISSPCTFWASAYGI